MELREAFQNLFKAIPMTMKKNVFNVNYIGESKKDILITKGSKGKRNSLFYSQKRAKINLIKEKTFSFKRSKNFKCLACDIKGHTLFNYWYLFKCKKPKGFKAVGIYIKRVLIKVEYNKDLVA